PAVDFSRPLSLREETDLKRHLRAQEYFLAHQDRIMKLLGGTLGTVTLETIKALPSLADSSFQVPLIALMRHPAEFIELILGSFIASELDETGLFVSLREQLLKNIHSFSRVPLDGRSTKPLIGPRESGLGPEDLVDAYLAGTPFHDLSLTLAPFAL